MIGLDNYQFGEKKKWRRQVWNQICDRLTVPRGEAIVLYLPGPDDEDGKIAIQKGFKRRNLIAVDLNEDNIKKIRSEGGLGIVGEFTQVLSGWAEPKIDIVMADFCCGLDVNKMEGFIWSIFCSVGVRNFREDGDEKHYETIIMVNLMRGRDASSNGFRKWASAGYDRKHRGEFFLDYYKQLYCEEVAEIKDDFVTSVLCLRERDGDYEVFPGIDSARGYSFGNGLNNISKPAFLTYKSVANIRMDTVIFNHFCLFPRTIKMDVPRTIKNRISATKAIRTMKHMGRAA